MIDLLDVYYVLQVDQNGKKLYWGPHDDQSVPSRRTSSSTNSSDM